MEFSSRLESGKTVITVAGRLDAVTAPEFERQVRALIDGGELALVVDFKLLDYISSAGLRALLVMAKLLQAKNGKACFANVGSTVQSVFDMSGFNTLFRMESTVSAAVGALAS